MIMYFVVLMFVQTSSMMLLGLSIYNCMYSLLFLLDNDDGTNEEVRGNQISKCHFHCHADLLKSRKVGERSIRS